MTFTETGDAHIVGMVEVKVRVREMNIIIPQTLLLACMLVTIYTYIYKRDHKYEPFSLLRLSTQ